VRDRGAAHRRPVGNHRDPGTAGAGARDCGRDPRRRGDRALAADPHDHRRRAGHRHPHARGTSGLHVAARGQRVRPFDRLELGLEHLQGLAAVHQPAVAHGLDLDHFTRHGRRSPEKRMPRRDPQCPVVAAGVRAAASCACALPGRSQDCRDAVRPPSGPHPPRCRKIPTQARSGVAPGPAWARAAPAIVASSPSAGRHMPPPTRAPRPRLRPSPGAPRLGWPLCRRACRRALAALAALAALLLAACGGREGDGPEPAGPGPLVVFAAASLTESMEAAARAYTARSGQAVQVSFAGSPALARQIAQRAPADVFVSADTEWMDWLQQRGLVDPASRSGLLGNALVLVAHADNPAPGLALAPGVDLLPLLGGDGRLAVALTGSVPAGKHAQAALASLGAWPAVAPRLAETENVRAALLL